MTIVWIILLILGAIFFVLHGIKLIQHEFDRHVIWGFMSSIFAIAGSLLELFVLKG